VFNPLLIPTKLICDAYRHTQRLVFDDTLAFEAPLPE
jgi:hypothetical protein